MSKESRLEILKGNDAGAQFRISGARVLFGRASDCDVVITDSSVSRNHAELIKAEGGYLVKDLKSSNGVFVNGKKIQEQYLVSGDVFTMGNHAYRYIEVESVAMYTPQSGIDGTVPGISVSSSGEIVVPGHTSSGGANKKRLLFYGGVGFIIFIILLVLVMGSGEDKNKKNAESQKTNSQEPAVNPETAVSDMEKAEPQEPTYATKIPDDMKEFFDRANEYYFEGKRELRMENYARALESFKKAVTFYPNHAKAAFYIKKLNEMIKEESEKQMRIGKKMMSQYRYDDAIRGFNEVMNLNARDPSSQLFKEAEKLKGISEKRKGMVTDE
ncbi:MAG: FHA domain-containing protein [Proteobacteria bacterium]|nr:FHA domain-containing protein [Pseudomonadota bacterium]